MQTDFQIKYYELLSVPFCSWVYFGLLIRSGSHYKNAKPPIITVRISHSMHEIFFSSDIKKKKNKEELTDARAFPISSPELPAVVPRLAAKTRSIISPITHKVTRTGTLWHP